MARLIELGMVRMWREHWNIDRERLKSPISLARLYVVAAVFVLMVMLAAALDGHFGGAVGLVAIIVVCVTWAVVPIERFAATLISQFKLPPR